MKIITNGLIPEKTILLIGLICLDIFLLHVVFAPRAIGYEISIYYPLSFYSYAFLIAAVAVGLFSVFTHIYRESSDNWWLLGVFIIFYSNLIILLMPLIRQYVLYGRSDPITHTAFAQDIISTGYFGGSNFYPISHILVAIASEVSEIDLTRIILIFPAFFYFIYICGFITLSREVTCCVGQWLMTIVFGMPLLFLVYNSQFYAGALSFMMIPLILFALFKRIKDPSISRSFVLIIFLLIIPFMHPITTLYLIIIIILLFISNKIRIRLFSHSNTFNFSLNNIYCLIILNITIFFLWISNYLVFGVSIRRIWNFLVGEAYLPYLDAYQNSINKAQLTIFEMIDLLVRNNGHHIIYTILAFVSIIILVRMILSRDPNVTIEKLFFSILFIIDCVLFFVILLGGPFISTHPMRESVLAFQSAALLIGMVFYEYIFEENTNVDFIDLSIRKKILFAFLFFCILSSSAIGIFNVHPSPYLKLANPQCSAAEFYGGHWISRNSFEDTHFIKLVVINDQLGWRLPSIFWGLEKGQKIDKSNSATHFLLGNESMFKADTIINNDKYNYLVLTAYDKTFYRDLWPEKGSFNSSDFEKLNNISELNYIYSNSGYDLYFIR